MNTLLRTNNKTNLLFQWLVGALLLPAMLLTANAQANTPEAMLSDTTDTLFKTLRQERATLREQPTHLFDVVDAVLGPHVDFPLMSRWVLGKYWRQASAQQQQRFITEFRRLLVRFYVSALLEDPQQLDGLLEHADGLISYQSTDLAEQTDNARVRSAVNLPGGKVIPVIFSTYRRDGQWRVYDVSVAGISLVTNYRSNFTTELYRGGLDGLITRLAERNEELLKRATTGQ